MSDKEKLNEFVEAEQAEDTRGNIEVANLSETVKKSGIILSTKNELFSITISTYLLISL